MIERGTYGSYQSPGYGAHCQWVGIGSMIIYFSYDTPIAFEDNEYGLVVRRNDWGTTTGKHMKWIEPDFCSRYERYKNRVPGEIFMVMLQESFAKNIVDQASKYKSEFVQKFNEIVKKRIKESANIKEAA